MNDNNNNNNIRANNNIKNKNNDNINNNKIKMSDNNNTLGKVKGAEATCVEIPTEIKKCFRLKRLAYSQCSINF